MDLSLHVLAERSSGANFGGGLVNFLTVAINTRVLFIFPLMMLEKKDCLTLHISALCAEYLFMDFIVVLKCVYCPSLDLVSMVLSVCQ